MRASTAIALATACTLSLTLAAYAAAPAEVVGDVAAVKQDAYGTLPNAAKAPKRRGDDIGFQEVLETLQRSAMQVRFNDGSELTLGANSRVQVDAFVYAPGNADSKALMAIPAGTLRYITGAMPKGQTIIDTPTATMVLRGTNVTVNVDDNGQTQLFVKEGRVSVHNKVTGEDTEIDEGDGVEIGSDGFVGNDDDETGDPVIDDGFAQNGTPNNTGTPEQRRGNDAGNRGHDNGPSKSNDNSGSSGGYGG